MSRDIVTMQECASWEASVEIPSSSGGDVYHVQMQGPERTPICECKGFQYREDCKHINMAVEKICGWHQQWGDETQTKQQNEDKVCPKCGGPTIFVRVMV